MTPAQRERLRRAVLVSDYFHALESEDYPTLIRLRDAAKTDPELSAEYRQCHADLIEDRASRAK